MALFHKSRQARDELWERLQRITTDLEGIRARLGTIETEWADTQAQVRRTLQRLERAQERAQERDRRTDPGDKGPQHGKRAGGDSSSPTDLPESFAERYVRIVKGG